jgi:CRP-like cAMP-binding protein
MHARLLRENRVLDALPDSVWERIGPALSLVSLPAGKELQVPGLARRDVLSYRCRDLAAVRHAQRRYRAGGRIGCDGVLGVSLVMGGDAAPCRAVVQNPGHAFRLRADVLQQEFERGGAMTQLVMRCSQALCCQSAQTALCNRHHPVEQQLARWLLLTLDCVPGNTLTITHQAIADALGVRRESVTQALPALRRLGAIAHGRNSITVLDRELLQSQSCECYETIRRETERLLPQREELERLGRWSDSQPVHGLGVGSMGLPR